MKKLTVSEKEEIKEKITECELNIEHTKKATMFTAKEQAEKAVSSALDCVKLMAGAMGVYDE